jgi:hypothetical protein
MYRLQQLRVSIEESKLVFRLKRVNWRVLRYLWFQFCVVTMFAGMFAVFGIEKFPWMKYAAGLFLFPMGISVITTLFTGAFHLIHHWIMEFKKAVRVEND